MERIQKQVLAEFGEGKPADPRLVHLNLIAPTAELPCRQAKCTPLINDCVFRRFVDITQENTSITDGDRALTVLACAGLLASEKAIILEKKVQEEQLRNAQLTIERDSATHCEKTGALVWNGFLTLMGTLDTRPAAKDRHLDLKADNRSIFESMHSQKWQLGITAFDLNHLKEHNNLNYEGGTQALRILNMKLRSLFRRGRPDAQYIPQKGDPARQAFLEELDEPSLDEYRTMFEGTVKQVDSLRRRGIKAEDVPAALQPQAIDIIVRFGGDEFLVFSFKPPFMNSSRAERSDETEIKRILDEFHETEIIYPIAANIEPNDQEVRVTEAAKKILDVVELDDGLLQVPLSTSFGVCEVPFPATLSEFTDLAKRNTSSLVSLKKGSMPKSAIALGNNRGYVTPRHQLSD